MADVVNLITRTEIRKSMVENIDFNNIFEKINNKILAASRLNRSKTNIELHNINIRNRVTLDVIERKLAEAKYITTTMAGKESIGEQDYIIIEW